MASVVACRPREAEGATRRVLLPAHPADAERREQPGGEVVDQALARLPLHDRGQRVRARLVVREPAARLVLRRDPQETSDQVVRVAAEHPLDGLGVVSAGHRGDVTDQHRPAALVGDVGVQLREVGQHGPVQIQQTLRHGEPGRGGGEALAERVEQVHPLRRVRRPPALGDHVTVAQQHQAVQLHLGVGVHLVEEGLDPGRVDALGAGRAAGEDGIGHGPSLCRPIRRPRPPAPNDGPAGEARRDRLTPCATW